MLQVDTGLVYSPKALSAQQQFSTHDLKGQIIPSVLPSPSYNSVLSASSSFRMGNFTCQLTYPPSIFLILAAVCMARPSFVLTLVSVRVCTARASSLTDSFGQVNIMRRRYTIQISHILSLTHPKLSSPQAFSLERQRLIQNQNVMMLLATSYCLQKFSSLSSVDFSPLSRRVPHLKAIKTSSNPILRSSNHSCSFSGNTSFQGVVTQDLSRLNTQNVCPVHNQNRIVSQRSAMVAHLSPYPSPQYHRKGILLFLHPQERAQHCISLVSRVSIRNFFLVDCAGNKKRLPIGLGGHFSPPKESPKCGAYSNTYLLSKSHQERVSKTKQHTTTYSCVHVAWALRVLLSRHNREALIRGPWMELCLVDNSEQPAVGILHPSSSFFMNLDQNLPDTAKSIPMDNSPAARYSFYRLGHETLNYHNASLLPSSICILLAPGSLTLPITSLPSPTGHRSGTQTPIIIRYRFPPFHLYTNLPVQSFFIFHHVRSIDLP
ncbi:hypothetical protein VP01_136g5 [Puccinia sorghi]|uniref:Uncharacterized protein n=1 Tax=Puccinia sorghi TaxID=27349 RepID=A0A0L6VLW3_9BASI|nr:hypothetical protein VP01_136g5 [Puccinia sorghi]